LPERLNGGDIVKRMSKAIVLESPNTFVKKEFEVPELRDDGIIMRVEMTSICASDKKLMAGTHSRSSFPKILGHEVVGFVEEIGPKAREAYGVDVGDRITIEPYVACTSCKYCLSGDYQAHVPFCNYGVGLTCDQWPYLLGGYAEYMYLVPGTKLYKINSDVPAESACLSSVVANGIRWVRTKGRAQFGDSLVIIGAGAQGLASVIAAKESGAYPITVVGIGKDSVKFRLARELGADYCINLEETDVKQEVKKITGGEMADIVIEASGFPSSIALALDVVKTCGRVVMCGLSGGKQIPVVTDRIVNDELVVYGGHGQAWDVEDACNLINSRKYPIEKMISHIFKLDDTVEGMNLFKAAPPECIRVGLVP